MSDKSKAEEIIAENAEWLVDVPYDPFDPYEEFDFSGMDSIKRARPRPLQKIGSDRLRAPVSGTEYKRMDDGSLRRFG